MIRYFLYIMVFICSLACASEEAELDKAQLTSFEIRGVGVFELENGVTFAAQSDSTYYLRIITQPAYGPVFVSVNEQKFHYQTSEWLKIDPTVSTVRVSAGGAAKTILFGYGRQDLFLETKLYPNPVSDSVAFSFSANTTGLVHTTVYNIQGQLLASFSSVKQAGEYFQKESLRILPAGIYLLQVQHGDSQFSGRIIKM